MVFGNFSVFKTPSLDGAPSLLFVSFFVFYIFSYLLLKTMGCFSGCLMSSAGIQRLFCGIYSAFICSFDEFVREKVVSLSYSSAILGPRLSVYLFSAALGLRCCTQGFSSCGKWAPLSSCNVCVQASHCSGFSCGAGALDLGLSSFGTWI